MRAAAAPMTSRLMSMLRFIFYLLLGLSAVVHSKLIGRAVASPPVGGRPARPEKEQGRPRCHKTDPVIESETAQGYGSRHPFASPAWFRPCGALSICGLASRQRPLPQIKIGDEPSPILHLRDRVHPTTPSRSAAQNIT